MDIPVYLITGFLDAGKTDFINGILKDGFAAEDRTLLLCCEEGETEYDPKSLFNVFTYTVDDPAQLTPEFFKKLEKQYRPKQVIIEFNGMWSFEPLYREGLPANWILYQIMCLVDATTFEPYLRNMGQLMMEKILNADMIIFNRCNEELRKALRGRNLRMVNRRRTSIWRTPTAPARTTSPTICPPLTCPAATWTCRTTTTASGMWT